jgi:hypothetical protein
MLSFLFERERNSRLLLSLIGLIRVRETRFLFIYFFCSHFDIIAESVSEFVLHVQIRRKRLSEMVFLSDPYSSNSVYIISFIKDKRSHLHAHTP